MQFAEVCKTIDLERMSRYSGAGNFHSDDEAAKSVGLAGAIVQGGQLTAYLSEMMARTFGEGFLTGGDISVSFIRMVRPGDVVRARGEVKEVRQVDGRQRAECEIWLENQTGEKVTVGQASAFLPAA